MRRKSYFSTDHFQGEIRERCKQYYTFRFRSWSLPLCPPLLIQPWFLTLTKGDTTTIIGLEVKPSLHRKSSAWTRGVIWKTGDLPKPVGKWNSSSLLSMNAFNASSCSGNSLDTRETAEAFSTALSKFLSFSAILKSQKSHSMNSTFLRKCNTRSDWWNLPMGDDVRNKVFNKAHQTGRGGSWGERNRTFWESG